MKLKYNNKIRANGQFVLIRALEFFEITGDRRTEFNLSVFKQNGGEQTRDERLCQRGQIVNRFKCRRMSFDISRGAHGIAKRIGENDFAAFGDRIYRRWKIARRDAFNEQCGNFCGWI